MSSCIEDISMHVLKHKPVSVSYEIEVLELTLY